MRQRPLTDRDIDVLETLVFATISRVRLNQSCWMQPLDLGGSNGSHHSYTLHKLAKRGLCHRRKWGSKRAKGSCDYRANAAGLEWLKENVPDFPQRYATSLRFADNMRGLELPTKETDK